MSRQISFDTVFAAKNMNRAVKLISSKNIAPGLDGMKPCDLPHYWQKNQKSILTKIQSRKFIPTPLRTVYIRKPGKREKRQISYCSARDQMLQQCIRFEVDRYYTPTFHTNSYGFICGRNSEMAVRKCLEFLNAGKYYVVNADIRKCFDSIKHYKIIRELHNGIADNRVIDLVCKFLKNPYVIRGVEYPNRVGVPQGSCLSPVLANIVLNNLDWYLDGIGISFVRYADDVMLFCKTREDAVRSKDILEQYLIEELSLRLNKEKTCIQVADEVTYLGYSFRKYGDKFVLSLNEEVKNKMIERFIKHLNLEEESMSTILDCIGAFNRGWLEYYGKTDSAEIQPFLEFAQTLENEKILEKMYSKTDSKTNPLNTILNSKNYMMLTEWYQEIEERNFTYCE